MCCEGPRKIHVEFGEVEADVTAIKWIEIINESCVSIFDFFINVQVYRCMKDRKIRDIVNHDYD